MVKRKLDILYNAELLSGILLMISFIIAILVANIGPFKEIYKNFVFYPITFKFGDFEHEGLLIEIVNDGLMTLFFLLIGIELKFHLVKGEFQDRKTLILPSFAAVGGIVVPALVYLFCNLNSTETLKGWAIPIATDTAFMLGILSFFGKFISTKLRAFIIGFSLIDDAIALIIIAIFYTKSESATAIILSIILIGLLFLLNLLKINRSFYYLFIGIFLWISMVNAGVHGTLCGVILALAIPVEKGEQINPSFQGLENILRPIVYFFILPLFAFINSGVSFSSFPIEALLKSNLALGIILGLFIGKQIGIFSFSYLAVKLNYCTLPHNVCWKRFYAVSILSGIGFTLSLFIGELIYSNSDINYIMRISVIIASLLSAIFGSLILLFLKRKALSS